MQENDMAAMKILDQKGASAVEFALVLPLLILLFFGIIEFGLLLYNKQVITNASREAARAGIVAKTPRLTSAQISDIVTNYCGGYLITFGAGTVSTSVANTGTGFGDELTVNVVYPYNFLVVPNFIADLGGGVTLSAETVMRYE